MNNSAEVCQGHEGCTSEVTHACNCGNPVVFLCKSSVLDHLSTPGSHTFISVDQARQLVKDVDFNKNFHTNLAKYTNLKASIQHYIGCLEGYKENLIKTRQEIMSLIEQEFQAKLDLLNAKKESAVFQLENIMSKMKTLSTDEMLSTYDEKGLKGVIDDYIPSFEIKTDLLEDAMRSMFIIPVNDYMYSCRANSYQLIKYDKSSNSIQSIELGGRVRTPFQCSSTCMLPDGNVMIVGGYPGQGQTYRFNPITQQTTQLSSLNNPRGWVNLICYGNYLYAFGGITNVISNKSERMDWLGNGWTNLPDMKEPRSCPGIICMDERIYFIGGQSTSVEYYDILNSNFNLVPNVIVDIGYYLAVLVNDKIYTVNQSKLKIMSKDFKLLEAKVLSFNKEIYMVNSIIIDGMKVYFWNSKTGHICLFDIAARNITELIYA